MRDICGWRLSLAFHPLSLRCPFDAGKLQFFSDLRALSDRNVFRRTLAPLRKADWVVYAKPPFAGPEQVLD
ncbi:hypothetical protein SAMN05216228_10919 [Rhizobium tibeticum]|uniref:Beta/gamma crystallin 'Greek key' domain-containing protein n=1 Tax=Rhizobium tibeticum TaxID=501024 RepID=A0ABY1AYP9_9HYPH|nr:hypothetical protein SAMN05216228_10919 [Rhizobium tibeticum]